jgi:hypothetical protein
VVFTLDEIHRAYHTDLDHVRSKDRETHAQDKTDSRYYHPSSL